MEVIMGMDPCKLAECQDYLTQSQRVVSAQVSQQFMVQDYYNRILELYFTLRKQRQYNFPELKTKFKISTGCGFKIDSHSQFEVSCGKDNIHSMPYDLPTSLALHKLRCIYHVIQAKNMGAAVARALYFSRLSGPSRTQSETVENRLLVNPPLYLKFRTMTSNFLSGNAFLADIVVDYYFT
uniref:Uncharacterized protein n=1 Tax=Amorphochlora amoebiformis TaxID=1561963 RepID=A0A7S0DRE4_9EUKA|mmetsp:Transcript_7095/g.10998  ORF Transcript_7095/g.10998 Transcript_7095/m.10998 type:complete len:181 (+) Transcript_7095:2-544(+)